MQTLCLKRVYELGSNSQSIWLQNLCCMMTCHLYNASNISVCPVLSILSIWADICHIQQQWKEGNVSFLQRKKMEKFTLTWEDKKLWDRNFLGGFHCLSLESFSSRFFTPGSRILSLCPSPYALSLWATSSMSTTSTLWEHQIFL